MNERNKVPLEERITLFGIFFFGVIAWCAYQGLEAAWNWLRAAM